MESDFQELVLAENNAARLFRSLRDGRMSWGEIIAHSQRTIGRFQEFAPEETARLLEEDEAKPLIASARILDTAAQPSVGLPEEDRLNLDSLAAVAFGMYGNFASAAAAVRRRLSKQDEVSSYLAAVLGTAAPSLLSELLPFCESHPVTAHYAELLLEFLRTGQEETIPSVRAAFIRCLVGARSSYESSLYRSARMCLEHIFRLSVAKTLGEFCPTLPNDYVAKLLDAGVVVFLPPQFKAIQQGLVTSDNNAIVALPTSTGKTLLGELCLIRALADESGVGCYLAPYVALGRQVADYISSHAPSGARVHKQIGGYEEEKYVFPDLFREIVVATPERLDSLLRNTPELLASLRCVVCDEAHIVQNESRGVRMEGLITRLRLLQQRGARFRLVLLSAVLSKYESLEKWLGISNKEVITDTWRPTARRLAFWKQGGRLVWYFSRDPLQPPGVTSESVLGEMTLPWPVTSIRASGEFAAVKAQTPKVNENVAYLADYLWRKFRGPILCLCATKDHTRNVASALAARFSVAEPIPDSVVRIISKVTAKYPFLLPLCELLKRGVAFHNSTVPHDVRRLIEEAIKDRSLPNGRGNNDTSRGSRSPIPFHHHRRLALLAG